MRERRRIDDEKSEEIEKDRIIFSLILSKQKLPSIRGKAARVEFPLLGLRPRGKYSAWRGGCQGHPMLILVQLNLVDAQVYEVTEVGTRCGCL